MRNFECLRKEGSRLSRYNLVSWQILSSIRSWKIAGLRWRQEYTRKLLYNTKVSIRSTFAHEAGAATKDQGEEERRREKDYVRKTMKVLNRRQILNTQGVRA